MPSSDPNPLANNDFADESNDAAREVAMEEARSEVQDYLQVRDQRSRIFPRALLVGLVAGAVAVAFKATLAAGDSLRDTVFHAAHRWPLIGWIVPVLFSALGAGLSVLMVRRIAPEAAGSGIPHLEAVLRRFRTLDGRRVLPVKFFGGALAIGAGLALGREGPTVQMGASIADLLSKGMKVSARERRTLLAAGAGAGLAAAFNAPLAGLVFVLEEVQRDFRPIVFGAAFLAAAAADIVARFAGGQLPAFKVPAFPVPDLKVLPLFAVLGAFAGLMGVVFNKGLLATLNGFARVQRKLAWPAAAAMGAIVGLVGWFAPDALGGGNDLVNSVTGGNFASAGHLALLVICGWFLLRFALTLGSYGCGAPGGIFAPMLALGALIGLGIGDLVAPLFPHLIPFPQVFAVVGMAAYFTAVVRAPLTGIVLIVEMTGDYGLMLPLIVACFCAYGVAEGMRDRPIYEALLERDLARGGDVHPAATPIVMEYAVQPGAPFDGKRIRDLGLPPGCIFVSGRNESGEWVPGGNTILHGDDQITAVISPEAGAEAMRLVREGCESAHAGHAIRDVEH